MPARLSLATVLLLAVPGVASALLVQAPALASTRWIPPVPGAVTRGFDVGANPFEGGRHRGADLAAARGGSVRAPCGGSVQVAGLVGTSGRVVTLLCGRWRVSVMPLAEVAVHAGERVRRGARVGAAAAVGRGHAGLHLGVRRDGDRFGYVDPLRLLGRDRAAPPPLVGPPPGRISSPPRRVAPSPLVGTPPGQVAPLVGPPPRRVAPRPLVSPPPRPVGPRPLVGPPPHPVVHPRPAAAPAGSSPVSASASAALAPWPAWAGLALLLFGAVGAGAARRARSRRAALPRAAPQEVPSPP